MSLSSLPAGFLWGTSSSAHQTEGNNINDWSEWEKTSKGIEKSGQTCNAYKNYQLHISLMKKFNNNAYRFSIEWSRIFPRKGHVDEDAINHYKNLLISLKKDNIRVFVTLHHFTNPIWFSDLGAFTKPKNIKYFLDFVNVCIDNLGNYIDYWVIINEPTTYILKSYLMGIWPPGRKSLFDAINVYKNLAATHNSAYKLIKSKIPNSNIGSAHQIIVYYSMNKSFLNMILAKIQNYLVNDYFYKKTSGSHDYFGINYYFRNPVSLKFLFKKIDKNAREKILEDKGECYGWSMDPSGIYNAIMYANKKDKSKEIYILEHGLSDPTDTVRADYLRIAIEQINKAVINKANVRGYLHWTLIDNFEWDLGYISKFGLCRLDSNGEIFPKPSAFKYSDLIKKYSN